MTIIRYRGNTYAAFIIGERQHYGERFVEVQILGFKETRELHHTHVKSTTAN